MMVDEDPRKEGLQRAAESERPDEGDAPKRKKERLSDLDVTDLEGGPIKGGIQRESDKDHVGGE